LLLVRLVLVLLKHVAKNICPETPAPKSPVFDARCGCVYAHRLDFDFENTLVKENMTESAVSEITSRLTRMNHEPVGKLHGVGTRSAELVRHDNLTLAPTVIP
jgi:hypothetical protein